MQDSVNVTQADDLFDWSGNPSWAQENGEHFDGHWVPDCQGKMDYDPGLLRISARVYPEGAWIAAVIAGDDTYLEDTGIQKAGSRDEARKAVEAWSKDQAVKYRARLSAPSQEVVEAHGEALHELSAYLKDILSADDGAAQAYEKVVTTFTKLGAA